MVVMCHSSAMVGTFHFSQRKSCVLQPFETHEIMHTVKYFRPHALVPCPSWFALLNPSFVSRMDSTKLFKMAMVTRVSSLLLACQFFCLQVIAA